MKTISVSASISYEVHIDKGCLQRAGELISAVSPAKKIMLVSDDIVFPLYGETLKASVERAGFEVECFVFPHGERSKTIETFAELSERLCQGRFTRSDLVVALGGGVVGDLAGFAAACYQRGIDYVQIPTTLLAMTDSSVGGKTAVDLESGKNQIGAFHQPRLVICDTETLDTLPDSEYSCGCAEIIKYALLGDADFFSKLEAVPVSEQLESVIATCVSMKAKIVGADEFDAGERKKLNLGHTIGHAVEACSGYSFCHGQAVAIGMAIITRSAVRLGYCDAAVSSRVEAILKKYGLPTETSFSNEELFEAMTKDKKLSGDTLSLIVPTAVGECKILSVPVQELKSWLSAGGIA